MRGARGLIAMAAATAALIVPLTMSGSGSLAGAQGSPQPITCGTSGGAPQSLAGGTYSAVTVAGVCQVNQGQVTVTGNVTVQSGAALLAAFANNSTGPGTSGITVQGNITVASGATLLLGCEAAHFACIDDPNQMNPTLSASESVQGSILGTGDLGMVVHSTTVGGDVVEANAGGVTTCVPSGIFATFHSPVYSDYEDNTIAGNLRETGLVSCWYGAIRNTIGGSATFANNTLADGDANENLANTIGGNLLCTNNAPAVQYGDSGSSPNIVGGFATGQCAFSVTMASPPPSGPMMPLATQSSSPQGYWLGASDGGVFSFGVPFFGSQSGTATQPIAGIAAVPGGTGGYNMVQSNGTTFGNGPRTSDCSGLNATLNKPIVGIAAAPGGNGCYLAASDGGVFALGSNAPFFGSAGALTLNKPIVGIAAAPSNNGYDMVASDGGVFTYGPGTAFYGSMGGKTLNQPVVGMATDPSTGGYWLVAKDGGIFSFNAPFFGSMGGKPLNQPIVGMAAAPGGNGYYLVASDGGIFAFGTGVNFQGSTGAITLAKPIVGMSLG